MIGMVCLIHAAESSIQLIQIFPVESINSVKGILIMKRITSILLQNISL